MKKLFKYLLFVMLAVVSSVSASAQTFTDKGFLCEIINGLDGNYVSITGYEGNYQPELEIPAEVQYNGTTYTVYSIGDLAFSKCSMTSVTIPDSVTEIGDDAFFNCWGLESVYISDLETWCNIKFYDWYSNPLCNEASLYLNGELVTDLVIPDSVTKIGAYAFNRCSSLTSVTIPDSVTEIGESAFNDCRELKSVYISDLGVWCNIKFSKEYSNPLFNGASLYLNGELVTDLVIPDSVTKIGAYAFNRCSSLTSVTIPDSVTEIGESAFNDCRELKSVTIGKSVSKIGEYAFCNCSSLTSVTIGESVSEIGEYAFSGCSSLTSVTIPDSVTKIGAYAFNRCSSLTSVTIPDSVTEIGESAFNRCSSLTSVTIPDSVTKIGEKAFTDCTSLTSVTIGESVSEIGDYAFTGCSSLTSVTIGKSVTKIGESAFSNCSNLTTVYISDLGAWCNINFCNALSNPLYNGASLYLNGELVTDLVIPDSVTKIGYRAFSSCKSLTSVTIPDSVTEIGESAFSGCSSLTSVTIGESVSEIGEGAFHGCKSLTSVTIPNSVTEIGGSAFRGCSSLTSVYISDLGAWCNINFSDAAANPIGDGTSLYLNGELVTDLVIPDSVTKIGDRAFSSCKSLTSVTIPDSVTEIGESAFSYCESLTSVTIPDSVTKIGYRAFRSCKNLTHLTIGESVSEIGSEAFSYCNNLSTIYSKAKTPPTITMGGYGLASPFEDETYRNATLYVPEGCGEAYKAAQWWSNFNNISEYEFSGIDDVTSEDAVNEVVGYYNAQGAMSTEPWAGLNIVVYSDGSIRKIAY